MTNPTDIYKRKGVFIDRPRKKCRVFQWATTVEGRMAKCLIFLYATEGDSLVNTESLREGSLKAFEGLKKKFPLFAGMYESQTGRPFDVAVVSERLHKMYFNHPIDSFNAGIKSRHHPEVHPQLKKHFLNTARKIKDHKVTLNIKLIEHIEQEALKEGLIR